MEIVINACHGGFGLSDKAIERYLELKGIEYGTSPCQWSKSTKDYWHAGHVGEPDHYIFDRDFPRDDESLVQVVRELGKKANDRFAQLRIVIIPDDVKWEIADYDGYEHVAEQHRRWYA